MGFFARQGGIRWEFTLWRDSEGIKGARVQYALSLLSTIKRGGRAELARAEPSDTELRTERRVAQRVVPSSAQDLDPVASADR